MSSTTLQILILIVGSCFITFVFLFDTPKDGIFVCGTTLPHTEEIVLKGKSLTVEVATTDDERKCGLSQRETLRDDSGMLFVFERSGFYGVWMKNTNFALDVVWIDSEFRVIHIEENLTPESYPRIFSSPREARYVLELPKGKVKEISLSSGLVMTIR